MTTIRTIEEILKEIQAKLIEASKQLDIEFADDDYNHETDGDKAYALNQILSDLWSDIGENYYYGGGQGWRHELKNIWENEREETK